MRNIPDTHKTIIHSSGEGSGPRNFSRLGLLLATSVEAHTSRKRKTPKLALRRRAEVLLPPSLVLTMLVKWQETSVAHLLSWQYIAETGLLICKHGRKSCVFNRYLFHRMGYWLEAGQKNMGGLWLIVLENYFSFKPSFIVLFFFYFFFSLSSFKPLLNALKC